MNIIFEQNMQYNPTLIEPRFSRTLLDHAVLVSNTLKVARHLVMVLALHHRVLVEPSMPLGVHVGCHLVKLILRDSLRRERMLSLGAVIVIMGTVQTLSNEIRARLG